MRKGLVLTGVAIALLAGSLAAMAAVRDGKADAVERLKADTYLAHEWAAGSSMENYTGTEQHATWADLTHKERLAWEGRLNGTVSPAQWKAAMGNVWGEDD